MRIGIDIRPLQSTSRDRGIGYYLRGLLAGLAAAGAEHEYVLLAIRGRELPAGLTDGLRAEVVTLPVMADTPWRRLWPVRYLRRLNPWHARRRGMQYDDLMRRRLDMRWLAGAVRRARLDVLHLASIFEPEFFANVGANFPCPTVQTVHDLIPEVFPDVNRSAGWWFWYNREQGLRSLADGPGRVAAISESARQDTERFVPRTQGRVEVIHNGVGDQFVPPSARARERVSLQYGLQSDHFFLTSGGTEWRKNLTTSLAAFARFSQETPGYQIVVPGRMASEERAQVADWAAAAGLTESQVICPGFVPDIDLPALYAAAAALVFPSRYEGFGLPVAEAMGCGCPVITARNSSLPEVAGDAALYIEDADDAPGLVELMQRITREAGLITTLRVRGMAQARLFSWATAAHRYLDLYTRTAGAARAGDDWPVRRGRATLADRV